MSAEIEARIAEIDAARERCRLVDVNLDRVKAIHDAIEAHPMALRRNRRLLAESQALLDRNAEMQRQNAAVISARPG